MDLLFLKSIFPEVFLSLVILFQLLNNSRLINGVNNNYPIINKEILSQGLFILFCLLLLALNQKIEAYSFNFLFTNTNSSSIIKSIIIFFGLLSFNVIWKSFVLQSLNFFEYFTLYFLALLSSLLLVSCSDLLSTYLIIELQALIFYLLASFKRTSAFSSEAGLKYFILGSFVSCLFLLGTFLIYACFGTTNFINLSLLLAFPLEELNLYWSIISVFGFFLIIITLLFKFVIAPFHFWAPDIYEGSPLASSVIFAILPKISLITFFINFNNVFLHNFIFLKFFLLIVGLISVFWGAYLSIVQKRLKRFYIYSSISQMGFIILILPLQTIESYSSIFFFLIIYLISSVVLWGGLSTLNFSSRALLRFSSENQIRSIFLTDLSSYFKINYVFALSFLIIFFSFAGIPPLTGFLTKFLVILSLVLEKYLLIALILILLSVISSYYYLRIIKITFFDNNLKSSRVILTTDKSFSFLENLIYSFCLVMVCSVFFNPKLLILLTSLISFGYL